MRGRIGQVIAPLFIIHRVANKSALTSRSLASGRTSTFKVRRGELTDGSGPIPGGNPASSVGERGMGTGEPGVGVETANDSHREEVLEFSKSGTFYGHRSLF